MCYTKIAQPLFWINIPALKNVSNSYFSLFALSAPSASLYPNPISPAMDREISIQCMNRFCELSHKSSFLAPKLYRI